MPCGNRRVKDKADIFNSVRLNDTMKNFDHNKTKRFEKVKVSVYGYIAR